ncbi:hypothetical protein IJJ12_03030, partial [bacterium]|nr:hypothetical protein [bacterium]
DHLSQNWAKLHTQLHAYTATVFQNQAGQPSDELAVIAQTLAATQDVSKRTATALASAHAELNQLATTDQIDTFQAVLKEVDDQLSLLSDYLGFWQALALPGAHQITLVQLDNHTPRTGGGTVVGFDNLVMRDGRLESATYATASQAAELSKIAANLPAALTDALNQTNLDADDFSPLANVTFDRSFADATPVLRQVVASAYNFNADLVVAVNEGALSAWSQLFAVAPQLSAVHQALAVATPDQLTAFWQLLTSELDQRTFQFATTDASLDQALATHNLYTDAARIKCPNFDTKVCYLDAFSQSDNYLTPALLTQEITHQVTLSLEKTTHQRHLVLTNQSETTAAVDFWRLNLPTGAQIVSLNRDNRAFELTDGAYLLRLGPGSTTTLDITYEIPRPITSSDFTYSLYHAVQSGLSDQNVKLVVKNNLPYSPQLITPSAVTSGNDIRFTTLPGRNFLGAVVY